jgi:hypothetical protein
VRQIRTLRAMWRTLETEVRRILTSTKGETLDTSQGLILKATAPASDPTNGRPLTAMVWV